MAANKDLSKLLRAIARGTDAKASRHDVIFNAAADELDRLYAPTYLQGDGGWFVMSLGSPKFCFWHATLEGAQGLAERAVAYVSDVERRGNAPQ